MGNLQASEFAGAAAEGTISLDVALGWHLQSNHFPPLPVALISVAREAIGRAADDEWDVDIELPEGIESRITGTGITSPREVVEICHLDSFVEAEAERRRQRQQLIDEVIDEAVTGE